MIGVPTKCNGHTRNVPSPLAPRHKTGNSCRQGSRNIANCTVDPILAKPLLESWRNSDANVLWLVYIKSLLEMHFSGEFDRVNILIVNQTGTYLSYLEMTNLA